MARRETNYTSISISKTHLPLINDLKEYAQRTFNLTLTSQLVTDFALELAVEQKAKLEAYAKKHLEDPRVTMLRKMEAERQKLLSELAAEGIVVEPK